MCIWLGLQVNWIRDRREARKWLEVRDCAADDINYFVCGKPCYRNAPWPIRALGEQGVSRVILYETLLLPDELESVERSMKRLFPEANVSRRKTKAYQGRRSLGFLLLAEKRGSDR